VKRFDFMWVFLVFIEATFTPFTSPSVLELATFAFLAVFKALIRLFFSMDMSAFPRRFLEFFVLPSDATYLCTALAKLAAARPENTPHAKSITYSNPASPVSPKMVKIYPSRLIINSTRVKF
jgi:hypothetical protein